MLTRILVLAALLAVAGLAQAEDQDGVKSPSVGHQNLSKRPCLTPAPQAPKDSVLQKQDSGLTDKAAKRINRQFSSRRPHVFSR